MVKALKMLISQFARAAELSVDTVRFYIRRGLLQPQLSAKGGANPYQVFTDEHLEAARMIRLGQSLGFTLREIGAVVDELQTTGITPARSIELMQAQLTALDAKAEQIAAMSRYMRAKIAWLEAGQPGPEPSFGAYLCGLGVDASPPHGAGSPTTSAGSAPNQR